MKKFTFLLAAALVCGSVSALAQDEDEISITEAQDNAGNPVFKFDKNNKYYVIELDETTKAANLTDDQYVYIGVDEKQGRHFYPWESTINMANNAGKKNSFGVEGEFKTCVVGTKGWSGLSYTIDADSPVDLSGISNDYYFHLAVSSTTTQSVDFYLVDGKKREAHLVLGSENYGSNEVVGDFPRDGKWYNIDIPMQYLKDNFGLSFKKDNAYSDNNLLCLSAGVKLGNRISYDAVFFYGPKGESTGIREVKATRQAPATYYTIDGKQISEQAAKAQKGIYIVKQGDKARKVVL